VQSPNSHIAARLANWRKLPLAFGLSLLGAGLSAQAQTWIPSSAPITNWFCVASSATGRKLFAGARGTDGGNGGPMYSSDDAGASWNQTGAPIASWASIACSGDGATLIAGSEDPNGALLISTNSGASWIDRTPASTWQYGTNIEAVAVSPDARLLVAANSLTAGHGSASQFFVSTNLGLDWIEVGAFNDSVESVACSGDGNTIVAAAREHIGYVFSTWLSTNTGASWTRNYSGGTWESVACSADGTWPLAASGSGSSGPVQWSSDAGITWRQVTNSDAVGWGGALAVSADARRVAIAIDAYFGGPIMVSTDVGLSWKTTDAPVTNWHSLACSADGNRFVAVSGGWPNGGGIHTARTLAQPVLSIASSGAEILISWIIPSSDFALQQSSDLLSGSWSDVPIAPVPNWSKLRNEVTMRAPAGLAFFRLASRKLP
jgi:hypothetical protein